MKISEITSTYLRDHPRPVLDKIERGEPVAVRRHHRIAAVLVPAEWFTVAVEAVGEPVPVLGRRK